MIKNVKFNKNEKLFWVLSITLLMISFGISQSNLLYLVASILGVTALLFLAKGEPVGQLIVIVFSTLYAIISFRYRYYGEIFTYVGMTVPSALITAIIWYKNPHKQDETVVRIHKLSAFKKWMIWILTPVVTFAFYHVLKYFETPNLLVGTASISTSFVASILMFFRSKYYGVFYALNDIVLVMLWILASIDDLRYLPMVICFAIFLGYDLYAVYNWKKMAQQQRRTLMVHEVL